MSSYQEKKLPSTITVPSSSSYLNIDTRDQIKADVDGFIENTYQNPFDISIYKPDAIFQGRVLRMALTEFNMLWSAPNVCPYNDLLVLERIDPNNPNQIEQHRIELGAIQTNQGAIPYDFYTPSRLASELQTYLNNTTASFPATPLWGIATWSVTFDSGRCSFSIWNGVSKTGPSIYKFRVNPMIGKFLGPISLAPTGQVFNRTTTLANMMGYLNASKSFANEVLSDTASMLYTRYIDIVSNDLTSYQYTRDFSTSNVTGRNLIARIFLNRTNGISTLSNDATTDYVSSQPFTINYQPTNVKFMKWDSATNLSGLNIRIQDEFGNLLYDEQPSTINQEKITGGVTKVYSLAGSSSYCQMTFTVTEGDN